MAESKTMKKDVREDNVGLGLSCMNKAGGATSITRSAVLEIKQTVGVLASVTDDVADIASVGTTAASSSSISGAATATAEVTEAAQPSGWAIWGFGKTTAKTATTSATETSSATAASTATGSSAKSNAAAQAAQTGTKAAKIVGTVTGGISVVAGLYGIYANIRELKDGDPVVPHVENCLNVIKNVEQKYKKDTSCQAHNVLQKELQKCATDIADLVNRMMFRHNARATSDIGVNIAGVGSGVCAIGAPFTAGASLAIGGAVIGGASAVGGITTMVTKSQLTYSHRNQMYKLLTRIWKAEQRYLKATRSGYTEKRPHKFAFRRNKLCQCWMTIQFEIDGVPILLYSTDEPSCGWYKGAIEIDPNARNIEVSFDVRGGLQLSACDRTSKKVKWRVNEKNKYYRETFYYSGRKSIDVLYELSGTSLHAYVSKVKPLAFDTPLSSRKHSRWVFE